MKRRMTLLALLCFCTVLILGLSGTTALDPASAIKVYYLANEKNQNKPAELVFELREVGYVSDEARLAAALKLMRTPIDDQHAAVLPKTLFITNSFIAGSVATIDLTSKYGEMKPSHRIALTAAMALSAFEIDSVQTVKINAFGSARLPEEDTIFTRSSFLTDVRSVAIYAHDLKLYYLDTAIPNLTLRTTSTKLASSVLTSDDLLYTMMHSSAGHGLTLPFDGNLSLGDVSVEGDTCYVDFQTIDIFDDVYLNYLSVYSIVNTVCGLDGVGYAVLSVNGLPLSNNGINFCDGPLTPVTSVVS